jgi:uncharacterized protein (DUF885 family)
MRIATTCAAAAFLACGIAHADATTDLHRLFDDEWQRNLRESPEYASTLGDTRYNDRWSESTIEAAQASHVADLADREHLKTIDRAALAAPEQINYDLFARQLDESIEGYAFRQFLLPVNQRNGVQQVQSLLQGLSFASVKDYEDWLARLQRLPELVRQTTALMRQGMREKRLPPHIIMERVTAQIDAHIVADPKDSPLYAPFRDFPAGVPAGKRADLAASAQKVIAHDVVPAYRAFAKFYASDYLPACPEAVGASAQPDGHAFYAYRARLMTTTTLTPQQIHDIGLKEVARIHAEMDAVMRSTGFAGSYEQFLTFLRTDPRFYFRSSGELFTAYQALAKRIDPELVKLFGKLPRLPYGVRAIPDELAPDNTTAYYNPGAADGTRPGYFYVNLYKPEVRPKYEMEALAAHESVPGHHLQIALAQELGELPEFRRNGGYTAFVEGWGLYAESLGGELGLYQDPYSRFGALTYEMWRAVRLVVDTGMHELGWSRQQAIDYFKANAAKTELDIVNEVDRYIAWPGQALAYKIGQLKIRELRTRAEEKLGARFDVRAFHDVVLGSGAVPLDVLERNVDAWIAARAKD